MKHTPMRVMVTAVGGGGVGEQILKALRLVDQPYWVLGADADPSAANFPGCDERVVLPPARDDGYVDALLDAARRHRVVAVLPGSEPELSMLARAADRVADAGLLLPACPVPVLDVCLDKLATAARLTELGFPVARTLLVSTEEDLATIDFRPAVLKPATGGGGSAHLHLAQDQDELHALGTYLLRTVGPFVAQEYLGTVDDEFTVGVLCDLDGKLVDSIALHRRIGSGLGNRVRVRNRTGRSELGEFLAISSGISQGDLGRFPEVTGPCEEIAMALGARGAFNVQCRFVEGLPHVFEINPRFSGTTSLRALVGFNEPDWLLRRHILHEPLQGRLDQREARVLRSLQETVIDWTADPGSS